MTIPNWKPHNGLAIDVAVTCPLTARSVQLVDPCEDYARTQKHRKYAKDFEGKPFFFAAMVFETLRGVNEQGEEIMRQLFTFAAQHLGREFSSYCSRGWARISCCLQRSVAPMVANRIDGRVDVEEPERESLVVVEEVGGLGGVEEKEKSGGEGDRSEVGEPLVSRPSTGILSL